MLKTGVSNGSKCFTLCNCQFLQSGVVGTDMCSQDTLSKESWARSRKVVDGHQPGAPSGFASAFKARPCFSQGGAGRIAKEDDGARNTFFLE